MKVFDVIIVGGGATGASALYHLSKLGITNTLLLEKKNGYGRGATGSWGSLVRIFHSNLRVTEAASSSIPFFLDFERTTGFKNDFTQTGSLYFIKQDQVRAFEQHFHALDRSGLFYERITPEVGRKRFPDFLWYEDDLAIFEPYAGVACPWAFTSGLIQSACARGATAILDAKVIAIERDSEKITGVRTLDGSEFKCRQLVLATGIWTQNLLNLINSEADIYPEVIQLNRFCSQHVSKEHPLFIDLKARSFGHLSFNGSFVGGYLPLDPEPPERRKAIQHVSLHLAHIAKQKLSLRLPWIRNSTLEGGLRAIDSYTRTKMGLIAFDRQYTNLLVSAGWSCGGFTTSPENGRVMALKLNQDQSLRLPSDCLVIPKKSEISPSSFC